MKKIKRLWALMLMLVLFTAVCCPTASAENTPVYYLLNGNQIVVGVGYGIQYGNNRLFLCPDLNAEHVCVNGDDTSVSFRIQKDDYWENFFAFYKAVDSSVERNLSWITCESPRVNETITILYYGETIGSIEARVTDNIEDVSGNGDWLISLSAPNGAALRNPDVTPWIAFNENGNCVGVALKQSNSYYLFTRWYSKSGSSASPSSQMTTTPVTLTEYNSIEIPRDTDNNSSSKLFLYLGIGAAALVVIAGIVVGIIMISKNKKRANAGRVAADTRGTEYHPARASSTRKLYLACRGGYQEGRLYPLKDTIRIGRGDDCNIQYPIDQPGISRHHVTIRCQQEMGATRVWLEDSSSVGTYLQRKSAGETQPSKMQSYNPVELHVGDVFYLAERANKYEIVEQ